MLTVRHDFSRWVGDVFGDHVLASQLRALEVQHKAAPGAGTASRIADAVRSRYELVDEPLGMAE